MSNKSVEEKNTFVPRITQVIKISPFGFSSFFMATTAHLTALIDANEFNKEIYSVLSTQLMEVSKHLKPGALNNELLGLKYEKSLSKNQVAAYALLNYVLPYLKNKYDNYSCRLQNIIVRNSVDKLEVLIKICNFFNTLLFLREGKYPTIVERLLKLKYCSINKKNQAVSYNYMTRELLWHGFMELLMYTLPLINYKAIKRKIRKSFVYKSPQIKNEKCIIYSTETKCVVCDDIPTLPCQISNYCPHLACYYCIKSNLLADEKFMCPECGETSTANDKLKFLAA